MNKRLFGIFLLIFSGNVLGDDHAATMPTIYGQSYSLIVTNPVAVIAALDAYRASPAAQAVARNTTLIQNVANGDNPSTHTINVFYQSAADMDKALAANATSRDAAVFFSTMRESATRDGECFYRNANWWQSTRSIRCGSRAIPHRACSNGRCGI